MKRLLAMLSILAVTLAMLPAPDAYAEPVNGLELTISADKTDLALIPIEYDKSSKDSPPYRVGTPAKLTFTFTNVSDKPVKLDAYDLVWSRLRLEVQGPDAGSVRVVKRMVERMMRAPREQDYPVVAPGGSWTCPGWASFPGNFGENEYTLFKPGEFRIRAILTCAERKDLPLAAGSWTGVVMSNEIVFKAVVKPPE